MSKSIYDIAMDNAKGLGRLQGAVMWTLRWGNLSDNDWKYLSRIYCEVVGDEEFSVNDVTWVREEASRRGVDIG
jgi:hypothetical protein